MNLLFAWYVYNACTIIDMMQASRYYDAETPQWDQRKSRWVFANYACNIGDTVGPYCAFRLNFGMPSFFPHPQTLPLRSGIMISHTKEMIQAMTVSTTKLFL